MTTPAVKLFNRFTRVDVGLGEPVEEAGQFFAPGFRAESEKLTAEGWKQGFTIHFEVGGKLGGKEDDAIIKIFNLPDQIAWQTAADNPIILTSGWAVYHDVIFNGLIREIETVKEGVDKITTFRCNTRELPFFLIDIRFLPGTTTILPEGARCQHLVKSRRGGFGAAGGEGETFAEYMARIAELYSVPVGYAHPGEDAERDKHFLGVTTGCLGIVTLRDLFDRVIEVGIPNYHYFFRGGKLYIMPITLGILERIQLSFTSGLISVDADKEKGESQDKKITMLLLPRVQKNSAIEVISGIPEGEPNLFRVIEFRHISNADEHFTIAKVEPMGNITIKDDITTTHGTLLIEETGG